MELVLVEKIVSPGVVELRDILDLAASILKEGVVREPVVVDKDSMRVRGNEKLFHALNILGVKYIPVTWGTGESIGEVKLEDLGFYEEVRGDPLKVYNDTLELLYRNWPTPLVKARSLSGDKRVVWVKLEAFNPYSNSIKDRIGWYMVKEALERGEAIELLYEATSTNTGIALASMAAILGKKAKLFVPQSIQKVTDIYLTVMGAEVVRVPTSLTVEAIGEVDSSAKRDNATHLNQFENDANFKVHLRYTAKELDLQLKSRGIKPRYIIGGIGTSGHLSAISFYFKNRYGDDIKIIAVQPAPDNTIPGIRRVETGMKWIHWVKIDEIVDIEREEAIREAIDFARKEGVMIGLSSGAVVAAYKKVAREGGDYILVFPDSGYKYFEQFSEYLSKQR